MRRGPADVPPIQDLVEEVIATFRQLRVTAADIHGDGAPMPGERGVLVELARQGPQTASGMARKRGVSRQHVQVVVNRFLERRLVELVENPEHRRSSLIRLTALGRKRVEEMTRRERAAFRALRLDFSDSEVEAARELLRSIRRRLQDFRWDRWRRQGLSRRRTRK